MNTKHTPGPWKFDSEKVGPVSREDDQSYGMVLPVAYIERFDFDNYIANANLISAAPELLDALKDALCALEVCGKDYDYVMGKARAAIAKAKGDAS